MLVNKHSCLHGNRKTRPGNLKREPLREPQQEAVLHKSCLHTPAHTLEHLHRTRHCCIEGMLLSIMFVCVLQSLLSYVLVHSGALTVDGVILEQQAAQGMDALTRVAGVQHLCAALHLRCRPCKVRPDPPQSCTPDQP